MLLNGRSRQIGVALCAWLALVAVESAPVESAQSASLRCKRAGSSIFVYDKNLGGFGTWLAVLTGTNAPDSATLEGREGGGASFTSTGPVHLDASGRRCRRTAAGRVTFRRALAAAVKVDMGAGDDNLTVDFSHRTHPKWATIDMGAGDDSGTLLGRIDRGGRAQDPFVARLDGGAGNDHLVVASHTSSADTEDDYSLAVSGGTGNDTIAGGDGSEQISGGSGADRVDAGGGPDDIDVDGPSRNPAAGTDDDYVDAGDGDDVVVGGAGADTILLGPGDDTFSLSAHSSGDADGSRTTVDCGPGNDRVQLAETDTLAQIVNCEAVVPQLVSVPEQTGPFYGAIAETNRLGRNVDRIQDDGSLPSNRYLTSAGGAYRLLLRQSGELGLYDAGTRLAWASHTAGGKAGSARHVSGLDLFRGKLFLLSDRGTKVRTWNVPGATAVVLRDDGSLVAVKGDRVLRRILGPTV